MMKIYLSLMEYLKLFGAIGNDFPGPTPSPLIPLVIEGLLDINDL